MIKIKKNTGAVALVTLVLIAVISLGFVISAATKSMDELTIGFIYGRDNRVFNVIDSCLEEVLLQIRRDTNYGVGMGTINFSLAQGECSLDITALGSQREINLEANVDEEFYKKINVLLTLTGNNITINSWQEMSN